MTLEKDLSGGRLIALLAVIDRYRNECGAENIAREAISALGDFNVGMAVKALVDLLDHADEGHRNTARASLSRIRNSMGVMWLDGSLSIIHRDAVRAGDCRIRRNALLACVDCFPPDRSNCWLAAEFRSADVEDVGYAVRLAARVPHFDVADRLMDIAFDATRDDVLRMLALESLAGTVRGLDADDLEYLALMLAVEVDRLDAAREDDDIDWLLERVDEVYRGIHERLDEMGA